AHFTSSDPNYRDNNSAPTSFTIGQVPLSGSITAANKVYDGTVAATITSRTLTGVLPEDVDNVSYVGGTATFADPDVGTGKTAAPTGLSLSGPAAGNSSVNATATTTADITPSEAPTETTLAVSAATPLAGVDAVDLTATVTTDAPGALTGSVDFVDTTTGAG